mmetsp:Transcript_35059/g.111375  ORF Transcript_35059/g.111375 Transcript_35059/m.111375 type:complete len:215 (+) Transcript_35059:1272-1916(+)
MSLCSASVTPSSWQKRKTMVCSSRKLSSLLPSRWQVRRKASTSAGTAPMKPRSSRSVSTDVVCTGPSGFKLSFCRVVRRPSSVRSCSVRTAARTALPFARPSRGASPPMSWVPSVDGPCSLRHGATAFALPAAFRRKAESSETSPLWKRCAASRASFPGISAPPTRPRRLSCHVRMPQTSSSLIVPSMSSSSSNLSRTRWCSACERPARETRSS